MIDRPIEDAKEYGAALIDRQNGFVRMDYFVDQSNATPPMPPLRVRGWAFATPGWPEFHACISFRPQYSWSTFNEWIVEHYETGYMVSAVKVSDKEEAPGALAKYLTNYGREKVLTRLRELGCL